MAKTRKSKVTDNNSGGVVPGVDSKAAGGVAVEAAGNGAAAGGAVILRGERGRFLPGTKTGKPITVENARLMHQARRDKTAALLRREISRAIFGADIVNKPIQAVATVGAQLYQQVASNPDANPRYRLEVWQAVGRHAGLLGDNRQDTTQDGVTVSIGADLARDLVDKLLQSRGGGA